jgi:hypothetical protein
MSFVYKFAGVCFLRLVVLVFSLSGMSGVAADPWPSKEFDVIAVAPKGVELDLTYEQYLIEMTRIIGESSVFDPYFPELYTSLSIDPTVKAALEVFLHDAAVQVENWGFPAPALKPVVNSLKQSSQLATPVSEL